MAMSTAETTEKPKTYFKISEDEYGRWRWVLHWSNHQRLAEQAGGSYPTREQCEAAVKEVQESWKSPVEFSIGNLSA